MKKISLLFLFFSCSSIAQVLLAVGFETDLIGLQTKKLLAQRKVFTNSKLCESGQVAQIQGQWSCNKKEDTLVCKAAFACEAVNENTKAILLTALNKKIQKTLKTEEVFDADFRVVTVQEDKNEVLEVSFHFTRKEFVAKNHLDDDYYLDNDKEYFSKKMQEQRRQEALEKRQEIVRQEKERTQRMHNLKEFNISIVNAFDNNDRSLRTLDLAWVPFYRLTTNFEIGANLGTHFLETSPSLTSTEVESFLAMDLFGYMAYQHERLYFSAGMGSQKWFNDNNDSYALLNVGIAYDVELFFKRVFIQYSSIDNPTGVREFKAGATFSF